jgi:putative hydrolase of the HAD superfamily
MRIVTLQIPMRPFKAIFFDLDDTLCDWQSARVYGIESAHRVVSPYYPQITISHWKETFYSVSEAMFHEWSQFTRPSSELRLERTKRIFAQLGIDGHSPLADRATEAFYQDAIEALQLFDDVNDVLSTLRANHILGIITNTLADVQRIKIKKLGLSEKIDHVLIASEVGFSKPSPEIFHRALEMAQVPAREFLFVGNSLEDDVAGARAAGVSVAWINRQGARLPETYRPDFVIRSLRDLLSIVNSI